MAQAANQQEKRRNAEEVRRLEQIALKIYDDAVEASQGKYHTIQGLAWNRYLNVEDYVNAWSDVYYKGNEIYEDKNAHWVGQRELAFLRKAEIDRGEKIGTDNLQQCVAIIIDGVDQDGRRIVALAHIDKYTAPESVQEALHVFNIGPNTKIKLYGGRSAAQSDISDANIAIARQIITPFLHQGAVLDDTRLRGQATTSNIIYNPSNFEIAEGIIAIKGHETQEIRLISRRAQNLHFDHNYGDIGVPQRDVPIRTIDITNPVREVLSDRERSSLLSIFSEKGCAQSISTLSILTEVKNSKQLSEYCVLELKPLGEGVHHSLSVSAGYNIKLSRIYKGSPRVIALCDEVGSRGPQPPYQGRPRRLLPDALRENILRSHRVSDDIRRTMNRRNSVAGPALPHADRAARSGMNRDNI